MKLVAANIMLLVVNGAAQTPAGWQVMKDKKQLCQIAVPAGWTADRIMVSSLTAPDNKASLIFSNKPASSTYADIVKMAKDMFKPIKTFEDGPARTWFQSAPEAKKGTTWYAAISSAPVCEVQIQFQNPAFEASAKQIVNSLKAVK
jgi:hypothetical protein